MKNKKVIYYILSICLIFIILLIFINDRLYTNSINNIAEIENIAGEIDNCQSYNENEAYGKKSLEYGIYNSDYLIVDILIDMNHYLNIEELILTGTIYLDSGLICYFSYKFKDSISVCPNDIDRIYYHMGATDIDSIKGLILDKELYLEDGAIYYFSYKF